MGTENYFYRLINQQKPCSEKLIKYVTIFYYIDIIVTLLRVASRGLSIISFVSAIGVPN